MDTKRVTFAEALKAVSEQAPSQEAPHPTPEELVAYQEGRLAESRRESVQDHLSLCPECTQVVVDLASFPDIELGAVSHERTDDDEEQDWRRLEERLAEAARGDALAVETRTEPSPGLWTARDRPLRQGTSWLRAAAVFFLACTLGLSGWVATLKNRLADAPKTGQPETNIYFQDLAPAGVAGRRSTRATRVLVPAAMNSVLFFLTTDNFDNFDSYEGELVSEAGNERLLVRRLVHSSDGAFSIQWSRDALPSGSYRIELFGHTDSARTRIGTYRFVIDYQ